MSVKSNLSSGKLLHLNFQAAYENNLAAILKDANVFGLSWLGNGATIKQTSLMNMLVMCGNSPQTVMSIFDCTEHMSTGGKFIMKQFKEKVTGLDEMTQLTAYFFFNSVSNI